MDTIVIIVVLLLFGTLEFRGAQPIGVCYGRLGNNLPSSKEVVSLYQRSGFGRMRLYDPDQATIQALKGTNIELLLGVPNEQLASISDPLAATNWVNTNILPHYTDIKFKYIVVGNEVQPSDEAARYVLLAMSSIYKAIQSNNLDVKISTSMQTSLLGNSYPPSQGSFSDAASSYITPILNFLVNTEAPLLVNIYPYFSYASQPQVIDLSYALFTSPGVVVRDGNLGYQNLFDATLDALYSAVEKANAPQLDIVVSETGWPSDGGLAATLDNAKTYYTNVVVHVTNGTPKRPKPIETYLFALFDENQKGSAETERHFGLFTPNEESKYGIRVEPTQHFDPPMPHSDPSTLQSNPFNFSSASRKGQSSLLLLLGTMLNIVLHLLSLVY